MPASDTGSLSRLFNSTNSCVYSEPAGFASTSVMTSRGVLGGKCSASTEESALLPARSTARATAWASTSNGRSGRWVKKSNSVPIAPRSRLAPSTPAVMMIAGHAASSVMNCACTHPSAMVSAKPLTKGAYSSGASAVVNDPTWPAGTGLPPCKCKASATTSTA